MTHQRLNHLLIGLLFVLACALILVTAARAEDLDWHIAGYGVTSFAHDAGYDQGYGVLAEGSLRWQFLELWGRGQLLYQHKKGASSGHTYGYGLQGRGYVYGPWYVSASSQWAGYRSEFSDGKIWEKQGNNQGFGGGYNNGWLDLGLTYFLKEHQSPNNVQYVAAIGRIHFDNHVSIYAQLNRQSWDQVVSGVTERWSGWTGIVGVGVRW
jgi:hypothetical protein